MSNQEELAVEIYRFIKASPSYDNDKEAFFILLRKFAAAPAAPAKAAVDASALNVLRTKTIAERTLEAVELSGNPALRYDVRWESLDAEAVKFFENNVLQRVAMALRSLATDDVARAALKKVTSIVAEHKMGAEPQALLTGDTLTLTGAFGALSTTPSDAQIYRELDAKLGISCAIVFRFLSFFCSDFVARYERMRNRVCNEQLPTREKEILKEIGAKVTLRPELETFSTTASLEFLDNVGGETDTVIVFPTVRFLSSLLSGLRLLMALRTAAADPTSKEMVANAIKSVVFRNVHSEAEYAVHFFPTKGEIFLACQFDRLQSEAGAKILSYQQIYEELMRHLNVRVAQKTKELREKLIPEREKELQEIFGKHIPYDVVYSSFRDENELNFVDNVSCA